MGAVGEGHEGQEIPVIVDGRIGARRHAKPTFDFRSPKIVLMSDMYGIRRSVRRVGSPGVVETNHANNGREPHRQ